VQGEGAKMGKDLVRAQQGSLFKRGRKWVDTATHARRTPETGHRGTEHKKTEGPLGAGNKDCTRISKKMVKEQEMKSTSATPGETSAAEANKADSFLVFYNTAKEGVEEVGSADQGYEYGHEGRVEQRGKWVVRVKTPDHAGA